MIILLTQMPCNSVILFCFCLPVFVFLGGEEEHHPRQILIYDEHHLSLIVSEI